MVAFALVENLARKAQEPHTPIHEPQQIVEQRVAPLEVNGDDGHFGPLNEPYESLLPLAVAYLATPQVEIRHCARGEETHWVVLVQMGKRGANTAEGSSSGRALCGARWGYGHKVVGKWLDARKYLIYHHFQVAATRVEHIYRNDSVEHSVGVVADGYEGPRGKIVEPFGIAHKVVAPDGIEYGTSSPGSSQVVYAVVEAVYATNAECPQNEFGEELAQSATK